MFSMLRKINLDLMADDLNSDYLILDFLIFVFTFI